MAKNIPITQLGDAIAQELDIYHKDVQSRVDKAGQKAAKELERITKDTAPFDAAAYHHHFADSIAIKTEETRTGGKRFIWHVKAPCHRLTHLLVHGHETRDGGRTRPDPFLKNALDRVLPEYERDVEEAIKGD